MIGTKTLREIREELARALADKDHAVESWLDEQFAKLTKKERADPKLHEELTWIQAALADAVERKKRDARKAAPKSRKASRA